MKPIYLMQAYVQQLESSRVKLNQLEQELEQLRQQQVKALSLHQEIWSKYTKDHSHPVTSLSAGGFFW